jgi:hypothetical protein
MNERTRIRGITIQQPWVWAILELGKRLENRTWRPSHAELAPGEWLALHASKGYDTEGALVLRAQFDVCVPSKVALPRGAVVAVARYGGVVEKGSKRAKLDPWFVGPHALELGDVIALPRPVECRGALGLWDLTPGVLEAVREGAREAVRTRRASGVVPVPQPSSFNRANETTPAPTTGRREGVGA